MSTSIFSLESFLCRVVGSFSRNVGVWVPREGFEISLSQARPRLNPIVMKERDIATRR